MLSLSLTEQCTVYVYCTCCSTENECIAQHLLNTNYVQGNVQYMKINTLYTFSFKFARNE